MIIFATITSVVITAHADMVTFSMTTKDPAQVRARFERHVHQSPIKVRVRV